MSVWLIPGWYSLCAGGKASVTFTQTFGLFLFFSERSQEKGPLKSCAHIEAPSFSCKLAEWAPLRALRWVRQPRRGGGDLAPDELVHPPSAPLRGFSSSRSRSTTGTGSRRRQRSRILPPLGARTSLATWSCSSSFSPTLSLLSIQRARRGIRGRSPFSCCWRVASGSCPWWRLPPFSPFSGR